jgi:hypothetical protein
MLPPNGDPRCAEIIEKFCRIVESACDEKPIHRFIEEYPFILPHSAAHIAGLVIISKFELPGGPIPDFAYVQYDSGGCFLHLVEIESPTKPIFREDNQFRHEYNESLQQPKDWMTWCGVPENKIVLTRRLRPILEQTLHPERLYVICTFISSRRSEISSPERQNRYAGLKKSIVGLDVMTYDGFIEALPSTFWRMNQLRCIRYQNEDAFHASLKKWWVDFERRPTRLT